jgi:TonB family protein
MRDTPTGIQPQLHTRLCSSLIVVVLLLILCWSVSITANGQTASTVKVEERAAGTELYRQGKFSEAAKQLRKAADKNKTDAEAWHFLGLALLQQGKKVKDATKAFETAVRLRPDYAPSHTALAYVFLTRNKLPEALREAQAAVNIDPNIREARYLLGAAHLRTGSRDEALKQAEALLTLDPQYAQAYLLKSQALVPFVGDAVVRPGGESATVRKERYNAAADALEKYLQLDPNTKEKQTWTEQLESLRFWSASRGDKVYSGSEVTTKAKVLSKPEPQYTEQARSHQITGTVVLRAIFAADGKVKHILVLYGLPDGLTEAAVTAAKLIKFIPPTIDGRPVSMFIQLEYNFNLY